VSARDDVLAAVRMAVAGAPEPAPAPRTYRAAPRPDALVDLFAERVADYKATVAIVAADRVPGALAARLSGKSVVVPDGFPYPVLDATRDDHLSAVELDGIDAVVTTATLGVAVTGTIVLEHGPGQGRRALSLVPDLHVCVVRADQIVADVPDAIARLDPARPQTWISGPSATSDIELSRVEGVHGPRTLHVIVLADDHLKGTDGVTAHTAGAPTSNASQLG
jgi:L-lactate dehydrogenase complex protein LldG